MRAVSFGVTVYVATIMLAACAGGHDHEAMGKPSGATCPEGSTLTYDTFGKTFMEQYCTTCHARVPERLATVPQATTTSTRWWASTTMPTTWTNSLREALGP